MAFSQGIAFAFYEPCIPPRIFFSLHTKVSPGTRLPNTTPGLKRFE
jgi:hypothetical protein